MYPHRSDANSYCIGLVKCILLSFKLRNNKLIQSVLFCITMANGNSVFKSENAYRIFKLQTIYSALDLQRINVT